MLSIFAFLSNFENSYLKNGNSCQQNSNGFLLRILLGHFCLKLYCIQLFPRSMSHNLLTFDVWPHPVKHLISSLSIIYGSGLYIQPDCDISIHGVDQLCPIVLHQAIHSLCNIRCMIVQIGTVKVIRCPADQRKWCHEDTVTMYIKSYFVCIHYSHSSLCDIQKVFFLLSNCL